MDILLVEMELIREERWPTATDTQAKRPLVQMEFLQLGSCKIVTERLKVPAEFIQEDRSPIATATQSEHCPPPLELPQAIP